MFSNTKFSVGILMMQIHLIILNEIELYYQKGSYESAIFGHLVLSSILVEKRIQKCSFQMTFTM